MTGVVGAPGVVAGVVTPEEIKKKEEILQLIQQFNCQRAFVRPTTDYFPKTQKLGAESKMIFATAITPFGVQGEDFPLASFGVDPIIRCDNCRTYLNPYCKFLEAGYRWRCNVCGKSEPIPSRYYRPIDATSGQRVDMFDRAELCQGSYDIKAGQDYCARPPQPPTYFFLVDVSAESVSSGMLLIICNTIKEVITNELLQGGKRTQFGIITFDARIHIYNLRASLKSPQMIVLTDPTDPDFPIPDELLVNIEESKDQVFALLDSLPNMFQNSTQHGSTLCLALDLAFKIVKPVGGRLFVFQASDALINEPQFARKPETQADGKQYLVPSTPHFRNLSNEMQHQFINVSIFVFQQKYKNLVNLGELARYLNGDLFTYSEKEQRRNQAREEGAEQGR